MSNKSILPEEKWLKLKCQYCGETVILKTSQRINYYNKYQLTHKAQGPFCNPSCRTKFFRQNMPINYRKRRKYSDENFINKCAYCGKEFELSPSAGGVRLRKIEKGILTEDSPTFCSIQCRAKFFTNGYDESEKERTFTCKYCGKEFIMDTNEFYYKMRVFNKQKDKINAYCSMRCYYLGEANIQE